MTQSPRVFLRHRPGVDGGFRWPAILGPVLDSTDAESAFSRPLADAFGDAVDCQRTTSVAWRPAIIALLALCGPSAIIWRVVAVVVDAVQRVKRGWSRTNVCNKVREANTPSLAHADSASAVPLITLIGGIVTTLNHVAPSLILRPFTVTVFRRGLHLELALPAAATLRRPAAQVTTANEFLSAAITTAKPFRFYGSGRATKDCETVEFQASKVGCARKLHPSIFAEMRPE